MPTPLDTGYHQNKQGGKPDNLERGCDPMFSKTYYATHPVMMEEVSNAELRDRYLIQNLFRTGECVLNYTHADRFVIGGVAVGSGPVKLPAQSEPPSAAGHPFLERRALAIVNVTSVEGTVTVPGRGTARCREKGCKNG